MCKSLIRLIIVITIAGILPQIVFGWGTPQGTVITNARTESGNNIADIPGEVGGSFTNTGGSTNYAFATNITTSTVAAGYDLSVINNPANQTNGPGSYVDYVYVITNRANLSAQMVVRISSNGASPNWGASSYELWTNYGAGWGLLAGPANWISNNTALIPADNEFQLRVRVNIPSTAADGSTNQLFFEIWDPAWNGATGDQWPGSGAIPPATPDLADARDYQTDYITTWCAGPVIQLVKSVDLTSARPFEVLNYQIYFTNAGSGPAYNLIVDDVLYTNYVRIIANSAETNNTAGFNITNYYYDGATWQPATWDNGNENSVVRVRWQLRNPVNGGQAGYLRFSVRIE